MQGRHALTGPERYVGALVQGERAVSAALAGAPLPAPLQDLLRRGAAAGPPAEAGPPAAPAAPPQSGRATPAPPHRALTFTVHRGVATATAGPVRPMATHDGGSSGGGSPVAGGHFGVHFDGAHGSIAATGAPLGFQGHGARSSVAAADGDSSVAHVTGAHAVAQSAEAGPAADERGPRVGSAGEPGMKNPVASAAEAAAVALTQGAQGLQAAAERVTVPRAEPGSSTPGLPAGAVVGGPDLRQAVGENVLREDAKFGVASTFAARGAGDRAAAAGSAGGQHSAHQPAAQALGAQEVRQVQHCVGLVCSLQQWSVYALRWGVRHLWSDGDCTRGFRHHDKMPCHLQPV